MWRSVRPILSATAIHQKSEQPDEPTRGKCGLTQEGSGPTLKRFVQDFLPAVGESLVTAIVRRSKSLDLDDYGKDS